MKKVLIIDYGSGNLHSIAKAFEREAGADVPVLISSNARDLKNSSHIVLPGVGAFSDCLNGLKGNNGMLEALEESINIDKKPFLGVCVGMQMLAEAGYEGGFCTGLGWVKGSVIGINNKNNTLKVPHIGWNELKITKRHAVLEGINTGDHAYFVHSYWMDCKNQDNVLATVDYGAAITAVVANDNIVATQFHPEKSQRVGLKLISNFLKM